MFENKKKNFEIRSPTPNLSGARMTKTRISRKEFAREALTVNRRRLANRSARFRGGWI